MKLYIAVCGMGLGHASRCLPLAKIASLRGAEVVFSTYGEEALNLIRDKGFRAVKVPGVSYLIGNEGGVDFRLTLAKGPLELYKFIRQVVTEAKCLMSEKPSVVISDSRLSTVLAAEALGLPSILILNQVKVLIPRRRPIGRLGLRVKAFTERMGCEVLSLGWSRAESLLIADFPPPYTISKLNLELPAKLEVKAKFVGPLIEAEKYMAVDVEEKLRVKEELGLSDKPLILFSAGGLSGERLKLLRLVVSAFKRRDDVNVVATASTPGGKVSLKVGSVTVHGWLRDRHLLLKAADLLITHGGHTSIAEAVYAATPMLIIPTPGHTERVNNARTAEKLGVAKVLSLEDAERSLGRAVDEVLLNEDYVKRAWSLAKRAAKFNAVEEVYREALKYS
ncbi:MAG: hypothetical protein DRJ97_00875 [Thermoprotei archaeon]|nr:MAG: hypothetical protein DRJ97_00875 [Thermoprotei archaeon]